MKVHSHRFNNFLYGLSGLALFTEKDKNVFTVQDQDQINERRKMEKQSTASPAVPKDPRKASCRHSQHQKMVVKYIIGKAKQRGYW